jgi:hypothetical protein
MTEDKSAISQAKTYQEIGEFWDTHDLSDVWEQTEPAAFEVGTLSETTYYPVEKALSARLRNAAAERGVSAETLLNLWLMERIGEQTTVR